MDQQLPFHIRNSGFCDGGRTLIHIHPKALERIRRLHHGGTRYSEPHVKHYSLYGHLLKSS
jgi:hypothetical protein